jgi:hypothetical protein
MAVDVAVMFTSLDRDERSLEAYFAGQIIDNSIVLFIDAPSQPRHTHSASQLVAGK